MLPRVIIISGTKENGSSGDGLRHRIKDKMAIAMTGDSRDPLLSKGSRDENAGLISSSPSWSQNYYIINILAFVLNAGVVGLSQSGLYGKNNKTISDERVTFVTPADYAFGIWGVIYTFELIFCVWQALPSTRGNRIVIDGVSFWFALASVFQAVWSIFFGLEKMYSSAIFLILIALSLIACTASLSRYRKNVPPTEALLVFFPIGLHAGWVFAAAAVNVNMALLDKSVLTQLTAALLTLIVATGGATIVPLSSHDFVFPLSVAWALAAISRKKAYRQETLDSDTASALDWAFTWLWILITGFVVVTVAKKYAFKEF